MSVLTAVAIAVLGIAMIVGSFVIENRIDDLEKRVTTLESVRIEMLAPPEGVSP